MCGKITGKRKRETLKGEPPNEGRNPQRPHEGTQENGKGRQDKSNEVDQEGQTSGKRRKDAANDTPQQREARSQGGGRRRKENPKATHGRRKKRKRPEEKTPET